ncbi:electron transport complex subunit RsxC [Anaerofilum hominis]|uniref:electron transport complex subunit RsxC n=1 Tax=Anaerofilum hominis TaxID=2763016 RepID=UPI001FAE582E|nr:electron transport complex subunit RsxC [Anaerofilum hominis]
MIKNVFKRAAKGAHVPHNKNTQNTMTVDMPVPEKILLPMQQHIGGTAVPMVKKGDQVFVGTLVGRAEGYISAPIHSGVSGTVTDVREIQISSGARVPAVEITADGSQTVDPAIAPPAVTDYESFTTAIRASGLVGLGGAGFPTSVKLTMKDLSVIDTLIINGAECEPYITADNREFVENPEDVMSGIMAVKKWLGVKNVIIAIERNKPEAMDVMFGLIKGDASITVKPLPSVYPQGAEKILIESCTGREVPRGGLPSDVGCIVMNVSSVAFVAAYLRTGMPLISRRLTVDGGAVAEPKNVRVIVGTPIADVLAFCGGTKGEVGEIITGGPMMGVSVVDTAFPILKQNNAVLAFPRSEAELPPVQECIHCGRCIEACPMGLSPVIIAKAYNAHDLPGLDKLMVDLCMECGCCSFVCPAKRPVTETMRFAKTMLKKGAKKK